MKLLSLLVLSGGLVGCATTAGVGPERNNPGASFGQEVVLAPDQSVVFSPASPNGHPALTVRVAQLQDSRCPPSVTCVWAGAAKATVVLSSANQLAQSVVLCLGDCRDLPGKPDGFRDIDTAAVTLGPEGYTLVLKAGPHPAPDQNGPLLLTVSRK